MKPAPFDYLRPDGVEAAAAALAEAGGDARLLAGGLSLVPMMNFRLVAPALVVDVGGIEALKEIADHGAEIEVGAGVAQAAFERWPGLAERLPLVAEALPHVGHYPTRARGTVGGSIAHADPSAELPLVLALLGGAVRLRSARGERLVPARAFFEGALETACREDEMVAATRWPAAAPGVRYAFDEVALRHGDFAIASCAALVEEERLAVGFGGVADTPVVREWPRLAGSALDDALAALAEEIDVVDDGEGGAGYRRGLIRALGARTVARAARAAAAPAAGQATDAAEPDPVRSSGLANGRAAPSPDRPTSLPTPPARARLVMQSPADARSSRRSSPASAAASGSERVFAPGSGPHVAVDSESADVPGPEGLPAAGRTEPAAAPGLKQELEPGSGNVPVSEGRPGGPAAASTLAAAGNETARAPARRLRAGERHRVELVLNGERCAGEAPPRLLLSDFLRRELGRKGVHVGCEHGVCGACTVRVDGAPARACLLFAVQADGRRVDTVEGLAAGAAGAAGAEGPEGGGGPDGALLSPLQEAFRRHHALQCGYCTPGILMTMTEWIERLALEGRVPDEVEVRAVLSGHLCRCTGYEPIVAAVMETAAGAARGPG